MSRGFFFKFASANRIILKEMAADVPGLAAKGIAEHCLEQSERHLPIANFSACSLDRQRPAHSSRHRIAP